MNDIFIFSRASGGQDPMLGEYDGNYFAFQSALCPGWRDQTWDFPWFFYIDTISPSQDLE